MPEQPELELTPPPSSKKKGRRQRARPAGWSRTQLLTGTVILLALVWSMWVTRTLITPQQDRFVTARLSSLVGEYVQAQVRSAAPPAQVQSEMKAFLQALEGEVQRRSQQGQVVLVGEAVLSRNVPDITNSLRKSVYAQGIAIPRPAATGGQGLGPPEATQSSAETIPPSMPTFIERGPAASKPPSADPANPVDQFVPKPSVSIFGGPDGSNEP